MTPIRVRKLDEGGLRRASEFLDSFAGDSPWSLEAGQAILTDSATTEWLPNNVEVDRERVFARRYDLAEYLHEYIPRLGLADATRDPGLWTWLALLWFEQLAPLEKNQRKVGERAKWVPEVGTAWRYYRHLVLGPYLIYLANEDNPERAMVLLCNPPHTPGEIVGQLAASQDLVQCKAFVGAATALYFSPENKSKPFKTGSAGRGRGSAERLRTVVGQFDRTFDLHSLDQTQLLDLLPREFERFRST